MMPRLDSITDPATKTIDTTGDQVMPLSTRGHGQRDPVFAIEGMFLPYRGDTLGGEGMRRESGR